MESVSNISSEEELLQLLNEGKISEDEYEQLRQTLAKPGKTESEPPAQERPMPTRTSGLAIASLVCLLIGPLGCIPAVICGHLALGKMKKEPTLQGRGLALAGLIIGYIFLALFIVPLVLGLVLGLWSERPIQGERIQLSSRPLQDHVEMIEPSLRPLQDYIEVTELKHYPLDNMERVLTQSGVQIDKQISSDGNGSLRIETTERTTVRLFETGDIDIENAHLIFQARLRTENVEGQVYLEMWCHFPGRGEFFSRGLQSPLTGTTDWTTEETPFLLKKGENPDNVKLNLVINGKGTVWIDDIRLVKGRLKY